MRYWKGSIALSPTQDYPLLRQVLQSTFITHRQLYELLKLDFHAHSRNAFNNRVLRLVRNQYLVRDETPYRGDGYVYSISEKGVSELIGLGEYHTGPAARPKDGQVSKAVYHAIELNEIHLALKRSQQLVHWMLETEIRSRNELTEYGYRKDYDALVTVRTDRGERTFALEYERTPKARRQYVQICADIAAERAVDSFLYLAPNYDLLFFLVSCFATLRRPIYFGLAGDFLDKLFDMPLHGATQRAMTTLRDVLRDGYGQSR